MYINLYIMGNEGGKQPKDFTIEKDDNGNTTIKGRIITDNQPASYRIRLSRDMDVSPPEERTNILVRTKNDQRLSSPFIIVRTHEDQAQSMPSFYMMFNGFTFQEKYSSKTLQTPLVYLYQDPRNGSWIVNMDDDTLFSILDPEKRESAPYAGGELTTPLGRTVRVLPDSGLMHLTIYDPQTILAYEIGFPAYPQEVLTHLNPTIDMAWKNPEDHLPLVKSIVNWGFSSRIRPYSHLEHLKYPFTIRANN